MSRNTRFPLVGPDKIHALIYEEGHSVRQSMSMLNMSFGMFYRHLTHYRTLYPDRFPPLTARTISIRNSLTPEVLADLLRDMSVSEIAQLYDVHRSTIYRMLSAYRSEYPEMFPERELPLSSLVSKVPDKVKKVRREDLSRFLDKETLESALASGTSADDIALAYGVTYRWVRELCRRWGVTVPPKRRGPKANMDAETANRIRELRKMGMSASQIAVEVHRKPSQVEYLLFGAGKARDRCDRMPVKEHETDI